MANESLLKMMKNAFYFILKALFVLKILSLLFGHVENIYSQYETSGDQTIKETHL